MIHEKSPDGARQPSAARRPGRRASAYGRPGNGNIHITLEDTSLSAEQPSAC